MKNKVLLIIVLLSFFRLYGQDSSFVLSYNDFISQVMTHHPSAFKADLIGQYGNAKMLASRGYTDPKIFSDINQKYFSNTQYYSYFSGGVKIPTWYGVSVEAGYNLNDGDYLNPENRLPQTGLVYAGVKLDIGNGLIWNSRRHALASGKIVQQSSQVERQIYLNELRFNATEAYLKWYANYQKLIAYQNAVENAEIRLEAVKKSVEFGDRPNIDTTEAFILLSTRIVSMQNALREYQNAEAYLETFLWTNGQVPIEIEQVTPTLTVEDDIYLGSTTLKDNDISQHPFIQIQQFKLNQSAVDLQLQKEQLKPDLSLKYNMLNEPIGNNPFAQYAITNYQWGASFNYAILTRKERGNVQLAKIKLEDQRLSLAIKEQEMEYKITAAETNYTTAVNQYIWTRKIVESTFTLYNSEQTMFNIGESSVFMINTRETNYLKAQKDNIDAQFNQLQSLNELRFILQY